MAQAKKKTGRHHSAIKAHRQSLKRNRRNRVAKKGLRLSTKALLDAAGAKDAGKSGEILSQVSALLDKAARKGTLHWKAAARRKSYLARRVSAALSPAPQPAASAS